MYVEFCWVLLVLLYVNNGLVPICAVCVLSSIGGYLYCFDLDHGFASKFVFFVCDVELY